VSDVDDDCLDIWTCDPVKGTLTRNWDGSYTYRAKRGYTGADAFTYTVSDGKTTATATITLNVVASLPPGQDCYGRASIVVNTAPSTPAPQQQVQYVVVNQGTTATSTTSVDWTALANANQYLGSTRTDDAWLARLLNLDEDDAEQLAQMTGLRIQL
jgi:hypothetical protein